MSVVKEFREFISRGNVIDLAVGVIIGAAFNKIVASLVDQVVMPPIGLALGGLDFSKLEFVLKPEDPATEAIEKVSIMYGAFANTVIQFLITAFAVFLLVKLVNAARRKEAEAPAAEAAPAAPTPTETLLVEIRDLLKTAPAPVVAAVAASPVLAKPAPAPKAPVAKAPTAKPAAKAPAARPAPKKAK